MVLNETTQGKIYYINGEFEFYVSKFQEIELEIIQKIINDIIDKLKWKEKIKPDSKILIKPNFTLNEHKPGVTTSPMFLKAVVSSLYKITRNITIVEGNGGSFLYSADEAAENHGVFDLVKEFGVKWLNISKLPTKKITKKVNGKKISILLPDSIEKYGDTLISLPVFKNHCMTTVTLGIKNLWGLVPSEMRMLLHSNINYYLPLISEYYSHQFTLIDGTIGLEGNGPMFGDPIEMKTILGANNPIIADVLGSWIMKVDPLNVSHIFEFANYVNFDIGEFISNLNKDLEDFRQELKVVRTPSNYLDLLTFKSRSISKIVFDSPLTSPIYKLFNLINGDRTSIPPHELKKQFHKKYSN